MFIPTALYHLAFYYVLLRCYQFSQKKFIISHYFVFSSCSPLLFFFVSLVYTLPLEVLPSFLASCFHDLVSLPLFLSSHCIFSCIPAVKTPSILLTLILCCHLPVCSAHAATLGCSASTATDALTMSLEFALQPGFASATQDTVRHSARWCKSLDFEP